MHIVKPQVLGLSTRPVEYRKRFGLGISGYLYVPFAQAPQGTLWSEQGMWTFLGKEMAAPMIDEGVPKLTSEFLVHGHAYTQPERKDAVAVRAQLGHCAKTLLVFGERAWAGDQATAPQVFDQMPLTWERAYGGPDFPANPQGRGRAVVDGLHWLPNLELPGDRIHSPQRPVAPAGFGALDVMHPQRTAWQGTYDDAWLKEHSPGFAPDLDWRYFNMAPSDQWLDQPLVGDEPYELTHLHPQQPRLVGRLPGLVVRCFANYRGEAAGKGLRMRDVPMRLTTVWFFPHVERMVLIFQGLAQVAEDDARDVIRLVGAVERLGAPLAPEHYAEVLRKRLHPRLGIVHALNDADLTPAGLDYLDPDSERNQALLKSDGLREQAEYRKAQIDVQMARDLLRRQGKDPDALGVKLAPKPKSPTLAELPAYIEQMQKEMEAQQWAAVEDAVTQVEKAMAMLRTSKVDPAKLVHRGPPTYRADEHLKEIAKGFALADKVFDKSTMAAQLKKKELMGHLDYLAGAHTQAPALPLKGQAAADCRKEVEWLLAHGNKKWLAIDLTGADLSGLDLSGIDFTGAWLESAKLTDAKLAGANFSQAVLAHADLRGADAQGACFRGANLGRAKLAGAVLDEADLSGAVLQHCALADSRLRGAKLAGANLLNTTWGAADWSGVIANGLMFHKLDLQGVVLAQAQLEGCTFVECNLTGVDLRMARLGGSTFVTCNATQARFAGAMLPSTSFVEGTTLTQADFAQAQMPASNLGSCVATGARFVRAVMDGANLGMAQLAGCDLRLAHAHGVLLRKTELRAALLAGTDLKDAILQGADLRGADLRSASLYGADLSRIRTDRGTLFDGAYTERTRTWPRLPVEAAEGPA